MIARMLRNAPHIYGKTAITRQCGPSMICRNYSIKTIWISKLKMKDDAMQYFYLARISLSSGNTCSSLLKVKPAVNP